MELLLIIIVGLVSGLIASVPIGPINLLIAEKVIEKQDYYLNYFIAGVIIIDLLFAAIAFLGYHHLVINSQMETLLMITGGIFVIFLGLYGLLRKESKISRVFRLEKSNPTEQFLKGVVLCGTNPAFLLFWVFIAGQLTGFTHGALDAVEVMMLLISIGLGTRIWFLIYVRLLRSGMNQLNRKRIRYLRMGISVSLIVLGAVTLLFLN